MLYLRAWLSRRRSWLIVVGAGHFHPAVLVPRVGPVSGGGRVMLRMGTGGEILHSHDTYLGKSFVRKNRFSLTHNIPRVSSTPLDNFQKP